VKCILAARDADTKYALDMKSRADAEFEHGRHLNHTIHRESARLNALYEEQLAAARRATELMELERQRREALLQMNLAGVEHIERPITV